MTNNLYEMKKDIPKRKYIIFSVEKYDNNFVTIAEIDLLETSGEITISYSKRKKTYGNDKVSFEDVTETFKILDFKSFIDTELNNIGVNHILFVEPFESSNNDGKYVLSDIKESESYKKIVREINLDKVVG